MRTYGNIRKITNGYRIFLNKQQALNSDQKAI